MESGSQEQKQREQRVQREAGAAGLQVGARIYQIGSGGAPVVAEVVRYEGESVVCKHPDGQLYYAGSTVAEAVASAREAAQQHAASAAPKVRAPVLSLCRSAGVCVPLPLPRTPRLLRAVCAKKPPRARFPRAARPGPCVRACRRC